jgi:hypothetical protein
MQLLGKSLVHHLLVHTCYIPAKEINNMKQQQELTSLLGKSLGASVW